MPPPPTDLVASVRAFAASDPQRTALTYEGQPTTYQTLDRQASLVANGLMALDLPPQSRIALLDFNHVSFASILLGAVKSGHALCPLNGRLAAPEVAWALGNAQAPVLFVGRDHYRLIEAIESELTHVRAIIAIHGDHPRWVSYEQWRDAQSAVDPALPVSEDDDIVQLYTSGTTGHPKGVCHTHRTWKAARAALATSAPSVFQPDCVNLVCLPLFHVAGLNFLAFPLSSGGRVVIMRRTNPAEILAVLASGEITLTLLVPALIQAILELPPGRSVPRLRTLAYGASPIPPDVLARARRVFACDFEHFYGMTENLGVVTILGPAMHDPALGKLRSCGTPHPGCEVRIVDAAGRDLAAGQVGEIIMRSAWIMRGYWNNPAATASTIRDGWLWTGDAGALDEDGFLYIHDRISDMIKTGGENVYPAEVEHALFGHPSIADAAVIGVPDARWGEAVKAVVVLKPGAALDVLDLERHLRARLGGFKIPRSYEVVSTLPRNASGKVLRRELRARFAGRPV